ncbi:hypothetical protein ACZ11_17850 [Lysinibacillus xylanilyticus]|uniref:Uncharacterized protein n=1 Tax=Lysinibacillus xylanilyticus TaxID=582475 RepID=A0A0K9F4E2_9BACI|nr:hypothetical protein [Lysinibacillus xylanilyticus]KMY28993.1 hypothetical protein ACZ11_17850 [Lysinibacillus xylanilyticus]
MKKIIFIGISLIIIFIVIILFKQQNIKDSSQFLSAEDVDKGLLKNTKAVIYLSTTADQDFDNKGLSYSVFVKKDHSTQALTMNGLELGSIAVGKNRLLLEDKNTIRIVDGDIKQFNMDTPQYTGERTGYLPSQDLFFSIYNSGFKESGYNSDVRYGNAEKINVDSIPYYILISGVTEKGINILTQDFETKTFNLREVTFDKELKINDITTLQELTIDSTQALAPILTDEHYYYLILSTIISESKESVSIYRINKKTLEQEKFKLIEYNDVDLTATIPYNYKNSATISQNKLFYANGLGEIYSFDLKTHAVSKAFKLKKASQSKIRHNEETYFKDGNLYVLRYSEDKNGYYYLETYSLDKGKLIDSFDINGLDEIINHSSSKKVYSYDLKVLQ